METKFKIGDLVKINKPKESEKDCWLSTMDVYIGQISKITLIDDYSAKLEDFAWWFPLSSLTKAEEQPNEPATKKIDWEQRRWELLCNLILKDRDINYAIEIIDKAIEYCKKHEQKLN